MSKLVYFSSASGNTHRFIQTTNLPALRIPISPKCQMPDIMEPYVLICPTYADGTGRGAVPKQVIHFLNCPERRALLRGIIASGNRNFGPTYCLAGKVLSEKCHVPVLYRFELAGSETDATNVRNGLDRFLASCSN